MNFKRLFNQFRKETIIVLIVGIILEMKFNVSGMFNNLLPKDGGAE